MSNFVLTPNAVAKLRRAIAPRSGNTGAVAASGRPIDPDKFPPPFTVRWSASAASGAGAWVIWLPDRSKLAMYSGVFVSSIGGVTAAQNLASGWYTVDDASANSTAIYLIVTITESTGAATAQLSANPGQATTGTQVINILVATMSVDANTGAKRVKQLVDSVVTLGGDGGGVTPDDVSTEFIPDPPSGTSPDGDEGKLQIKGFKTGTPADTNTIAEYLMGTAQIGGSIWLLVRGQGTGGDPILGYIPLDALDLDDYAKQTDLPTVNNGTLTIMQGTAILGSFTANQSTNKTIEIPTLSGVDVALEDITWDATNHTLVKHWRSLNLATGAIAHDIATPPGMTNTISTTPISSIIP